MSNQYIGEIRMMGCNFAPQGWLMCNGALLPISQYEALYTLLGTTYGGDGQTTFGLPDLRSRVPIGAGNGPGLSPYAMGQMVGLENVTLTTNTMPGHTHPFMAITTNAGSANPTNALPAMTTNTTFYSDKQPNATLAPTSVAPNSGGGSQPHTNIQPVQAQNFVIAVEGIYPSSS